MRALVFPRDKGRENRKTRKMSDHEARGDPRDESQESPKMKLPHSPEKRKKKKHLSTRARMRENLTLEERKEAIERVDEHAIERLTSFVRRLSLTAAGTPGGSDDDSAAAPSADASAPGTTPPSPVAGPVDEKAMLSSAAEAFLRNEMPQANMQPVMRQMFLHTCVSARKELLQELRVSLFNSS